MKQQKLFHLVLSAMLIVCTTGCYDKDEIKDAEKYLFKDIQYSFEGKYSINSPFHSKNVMLLL